MICLTHNKILYEYGGWIFYSHGYDFYMKYKHSKYLYSYGSLLYWFTWYTHCRVKIL